MARKGLAAPEINEWASQAPIKSKKMRLKVVVSPSNKVQTTLTSINDMPKTLIPDWIDACLLFVEF